MTTKANLDIRKAMQEANIKQWQVADLIGISEATILRKLRKELPQEEKNKIFNAIEELKEKIN